MSKSQQGSLCMWILQVIVVFLLLFFFLYLALRPSDPTYTIVGFSASGNNFSFGLDISNNNMEGGVRFGDVKLTLCSADKRVVGGTALGPFYLRHGRSMQWWETLSASGGDPDVTEVEGMIVDLKTVVRYRILAWETPSYPVRLVGVVLPDDSDGGISSNSIALRAIRKNWWLKI